MKKVLLVCLAIFLFFANCQKKEEPKVQTPFPAGPVQTNNEIRLLQEALRQNPNDLNAWINLGNIMMDTSRFDEAINAYQHALELNPKNVDVKVDMGTCYKNIGKPDRAAEEFRKAIKINPRHLYAHRNLGVVLAFDIGDKKSAIKEFEEYLRLSPDTPDTQRIRQEVAKLKASE